MVRPTRSLIWLVCAGIGTGILSCERDLKPFEGYVYRSRFFEYHERNPAPLCSTLLSLLDQHAEVISAKIALTLDENQPFHYYRFRDLADFASNAGSCSPKLGACAQGGAVYSTKFFHAHELAHEYTFRAWGGWTTGLLSEGEAVALSCEPFYPLQPSQRPSDVLELASLNWRDLLHLHVGSTNAEYTAAGFFVAHLAERYGWRSVGELHRRVPRGISATDFEREFARVYPTSMDQAWSEALDVPGASPCHKDWPCIANPMRVGQVAVPDCDGEMHRSISVPESGTIVFSLEGENAELRLLNCVAADSPSYLLTGGLAAMPWATHWARLPAGKYTMFNSEGGALPRRVEFDSYVPGQLVSDSCTSSGSVILNPERETYIDLLPADLVATEAEGWIRIRGSGHVYGVFPQHLAWNSQSTTVPLAICDDCDPAASCTPLVHGELTTVTIGDHSAIRIQNVFAAPPPTSAWGQLVFRPAKDTDL